MGLLGLVDVPLWCRKVFALRNSGPRLFPWCVGDVKTLYPVSRVVFTLLEPPPPKLDPLRCILEEAEFASHVTTMLLLPTLPSTEDTGDVPPDEWRARNILAKSVPRLLLGDGRFELGEKPPPLPTDVVSTFKYESSASALLVGEDTHRCRCLSFSSSLVDTMTTSDFGDGTFLLLLWDEASPKYGHVQGGGNGNETDDFFRTGVGWLFASISKFESFSSSLPLFSRGSVVSDVRSSEAESLVLCWVSLIVSRLLVWSDPDPSDTADDSLAFLLRRLSSWKLEPRFRVNSRQLRYRDCSSSRFEYSRNDSVSWNVEALRRLEILWPGYGEEDPDEFCCSGCCSDDCELARLSGALLLPLQEIVRRSWAGTLIYGWNLTVVKFNTRHVSCLNKHTVLITVRNSWRSVFTLFGVVGFYMNINA